MHKLRVAVVIFVLLTLFWGGFAEAQDGATPAPNGSMVVHVVQRGENLYRIAERYGVEVTAIMTANNIADARFIETGQRLLIPDAQTPAPNIEATHIVQVGESLQLVALRYGVPVETLAARNNITHPHRLVVGQRLVVGGNSPNALITVQPGDNLLRIAARVGVPATTIREANDLQAWEPLLVGQTLIIPEQTPNIGFVNFSAPLLDLSLTPATPVQGQSISLRFETSTSVQGQGMFMGRPFQTALIEGNQYAAILGVHAFAEPGVYSVDLNLADDVGQTTRHQFRIQVAAGDFGSEAIDIPAASAYLLGDDVVRPELEIVAGLMTQYSPQRTFDGMMSLPVTGQVTSAFGTRRSYNGNAYNTFHGGVDFFASPGTPITVTADGVVVLAQPLQIRGNAVIVDHGWGVFTGYWHMSEIYVEVGQQLNTGQPVGALGATGLGTGPHLHWEMWAHGVQVDPMQWLRQAFP